jgi:hypothetical protein
MDNYKCYFDHSVLNDSDFDGTKDTVVKIVSIGMEKIQTQDGEETTLCARLEGYKLPLRLISCIGYSISRAYKHLGHAQKKDPKNWIGKHISIYIEYDYKAFGKYHDVLRVRPVAPKISGPATADQLVSIRAGFESIDMTEADYCAKAQLAKLEDIKEDKARDLIAFMSSKAVK